MTKKIGFFILYLIIAINFVYAQQHTDLPKNKSVGERVEDKDIKINPDALKALNLGAPRKLSNRYYSVPESSVKDLTDEILGKKKSLDEPQAGRIMLGVSRFASFYNSPNRTNSRIKVDAMGFGLEMPKRGGMVLSKAAMARKYTAGIVFPSINRINQVSGVSFSLESILQSIFHRDPPKLWNKYRDIARVNYNVETEMPDSLVRIRQATVEMIDSLIKSSHKKYKIVYLLCEDTDLSKSGFLDIAKYVHERKNEFDLFPVSDKGMKEVSCIAKYLKKNAYFSPVYVMSGKHKEKLILMLDKSSQTISLMACDESIANELDKLKRLP